MKINLPSPEQFAKQISGFPWASLRTLSRILNLLVRFAQQTRIFDLDEVMSLKDLVIHELAARRGIALHSSAQITLRDRL